MAEHSAPGQRYRKGITPITAGVAQNLLGQNRDAFAELQTALEQVGYRLLPLFHQPERRIQHETAPGLGHCPKVGLVYGAPHPGMLERSGGQVCRAGGSR